MKILILPKEILIHIVQYAIDRLDVIPILSHVNKEFREIIMDNDVWIHVANLLDSNKSMTPIQAIVNENRNTQEGNHTIFMKIQQYFQSLRYIQYIQLVKEDNCSKPETMVFDPFSKLAMGDSKSFSDLIDLFGINSFRAYHFVSKGTDEKITDAACAAIMDTMGFDSGKKFGETIIQASFVVGEEPNERWVNAYLITFNDKNQQVQEPPLLTCPALNVTVTSPTPAQQQSYYDLIDRMKELLSTRFERKASFVCFEKVHIKRSKLFKITKKEELKNKRMKQMAKQKRFEFWFGDQTSNNGANGESFFRFVKPFSAVV
ncbi:hypothetical protein FDP41_012828 [Naegleria fowleri]|uniref:F-box domain-containing protein n=1 Tax=Naegleria fowleri TaxID=5763 RepID=A0A6A5C5B3_NAEFO|nr:uncharacterized protein FDP41_012828 [Naegleria fowleri]KAF0981040.1 hypothetical protein FDP41_012828 [Naegleria fowleri]CAG4717323.1 unnamed protein product [Naegleria fowleri]